MSNEAAERLLGELQENPMPGARHSYGIVRDRLPKVLAAERKATVERIRAAFDAEGWNDIDAILDAEAER